MTDLLPTIPTDGGPRTTVPVVQFDPTGRYSGSIALTPLGYVQVGVPDDAVTPIADVPEGSTIALVRVEGADIRYRDDGVDPTPEVGMPLLVGESMTYDADMSDIRLIGQASGAICNVAFYGVATDA